MAVEQQPVWSPAILVIEEVRPPELGLAGAEALLAVFCRPDRVGACFHGAEALVAVPEEVADLEQTAVELALPLDHLAVAAVGEEGVGGRLAAGRRGVRAPVHPEQLVVLDQPVVVGIAAERSPGDDFARPVAVRAVGVADRAQIGVALLDQLVVVVIRPGVGAVAAIHLPPQVAGGIVDPAGVGVEVLEGLQHVAVLLPDQEAGQPVPPGVGPLLLHPVGPDGEHRLAIGVELRPERLREGVHQLAGAALAVAAILVGANVLWGNSEGAADGPRGAPNGRVGVGVGVLILLLLLLLLEAKRRNPLQQVSAYGVGVALASLLKEEAATSFAARTM